VRRAKRGAADAALVTGTGKDLLEAVAAHVLQQRYGLLLRDMCDCILNVIRTCSFRPIVRNERESGCFIILFIRPGIWGRRFVLKGPAMVGKLA